jgi:hypothetical protein
VLYKFKSKNAGDVIMLQAHGQRVLALIGKAPGAQGIVLTADMARAISAVQAQGHDSVSLRQRAQPFMALLKQAQSSGDDIVWGV